MRGLEVLVFPSLATFSFRPGPGFASTMAEPRLHSAAFYSPFCIALLIPDICFFTSWPTDHMNNKGLSQPLASLTSHHSSLLNSSHTHLSESGDAWNIPHQCLHILEPLLGHSLPFAPVWKENHGLSYQKLSADVHLQNIFFTLCLSLFL